MLRRGWIAALVVSMAAATVARADGAGSVPSGAGWWCMDMPGPTGRCARARSACEAEIASMPWGGVPPPCVPRAEAHCATYSAGHATSPPRPAWLCRRDAAGCSDAIAQVVAAHPPPQVVSASPCAPTR